MRFRPAQHLRRQGDIRAVREHGQRIDCRAFTIWWKSASPESAASTPASPLTTPTVRPLATSGGRGARVCVIASTAAVGHAVRRNRAKRRLREVFRQGQTLVPTGCDLLLIARAAATDWPLPELARKFAEACTRISVETAEGRG